MSGVLNFPVSFNMERYIRAMERHAKALEEYNRLTAEEHTREDVRRQQVVLLGDIESRRIDVVKKIVADHYGLRISQLSNQQRAQGVARPRHVAMALCKYHTDYSLPKIGRHFGGRDHTTVMNAVKRVAMLLEADEDLLADYRACECRVITALASFQKREDAG